MSKKREQFRPVWVVHVSAESTRGQEYRRQAPQVAHSSTSKRDMVETLDRQERHDSSTRQAIPPPSRLTKIRSSLKTMTLASTASMPSGMASGRARPTES